MADESNASDIYRSGEYRVRHPDWHEADAPFKARHIFEMLQRHPFPIATIAEIGCGSGAVLAELSRRLPDVSFFGFDVAPAAIEIARKFESERVHFELRELDPTTFRYSILRVFDPATPTRVIDEAESHFKQALDTRKHGLNRN